MKIKPRSGMPNAEGDMTPMIDMAFQLIAFFMVLLNFSEAEQDERVKLPSSVLAKPPATATQNPLTVQITSEKQLVFGGLDYAFADLPKLLAQQRDLMLARKQDPKEVQVIIRADGTLAIDTVQEVIESCQKASFENFVLRAKQQESY